MRIALALALALVLVAAVPAAAARRPSPRAQSQAVAAELARDQLVSCGGSHGNAVALTFDDGPSPYSAAIVRTLRRFHARATFFLVGNRLQYWPKAARLDASVGAIGNHTWSHPDLRRLPTWLVWLEVVQTQAAIEEDTGVTPVLFRVPYALHTLRTDETVRNLGLLEVFWDVDSQDDLPEARVSDVVRNVERGLRPGAIVIMHDLHPWTVAALPQILAAIHKRHLRAVTVPELLAEDPPAANQRCPYSPVAGD
ncbi:MAG TPA: polysaccharide deacetylase family protein [Gaiellaceae bacterium]|nr:polysaccharide deacetylase family protein [Gaiellaceae bacterium]